METKVTGKSLQTSLLNNLNKVNSSIGSNLNKLSTGLRITKASDDAAGLSIATRLSSDSNALSQSLRNINDGVSLTNTAEGGLGQISDLLTRGRELAVQSANGTLDPSARQAISAELTSIKSEINRIAETTEFNGQKLTNGDLAPNSSTQIDIQAGSGGDSSNRINLNVVSASRTTDLGVDSADVSTQSNARNAITSFTSAIDQVSSQRASIGAVQNRLGAAASNLGVSIENINSAVSNIRDLDFASESAKFAQNQILQKANLQTISQSSAISGELVGKLLNVRG